MADQKQTDTSRNNAFFTKALESLSNSNKDNSEKSIKLQTISNQLLMHMGARINQLVDMWAPEDPLKKAEREKENRDLLGDILKTLRNKPKEIEQKEKKKSYGWMGLVFGGIAALGAALVSFVGELWRQFKTLTNLDRYLAPLFKGFKNLFTNEGAIGKIFAKLKTAFTEEGAIGKIFAKLNALFTEEGAIGKAFAKLKTAFKESSLGKWIDDIILKWKEVKTSFQELFGSGKSASKGTGFFSRLKGLIVGEGSLIGKALKFLNPFIKFGSAIGKFAAKLVAPLALIMTVWDGVTGFMEGWQAQEGKGLGEKLVGGIMGAISKILSNLVGGIMDLVKDSIAWVLEKLGIITPETKEALNSFSFADIIKRVFKSITDFLTGDEEYWQNAYELMSQAWTSVSDSVMGMFKSIVAGILPTYDAKREWWNPLNLVTSAIPDSVYKWAGVDKEGNVMVGNRVISKDEYSKLKALNPDFEELQQENMIKQYQRLRVAPGSRMPTMREAADTLRKQETGVVVFNEAPSNVIANDNMRNALNGANYMNMYGMPR